MLRLSTLVFLFAGTALAGAPSDFGRISRSGTKAFQPYLPTSGGLTLRSRLRDISQRLALRPCAQRPGRQRPTRRPQASGQKIPAKKLLLPSQGKAAVPKSSEGQQRFTLPQLISGAIASGGLTLGLLLGVMTPSLPALADYDMMMNPNEAFKTQKYLGTWYEVASLKKGFAGTGQEDCHCTQGMYQLDKYRNRILVNTFCAHGSPEGRISGIMGVVKCLNPMSDGTMKETFLKECKLKFPAIPFIPSEPYDIIATDYKSYALVQGAKDKSFVQIYSRKPKPGSAFIEAKKKMLQERGFNIEDIKDTPQDCDNKMIGKMMTKMMEKEMESPSKEDTPTVITPPAVGIELNRDQFGPKFLLTEVKDLAKLIAESTLGALVPSVPRS